ncbi:MAG: tetratricopeptide repeat protein [Treponema sp.]|jgi:tetratricopeptide (TPR) repeat protein|nr:tetratricopeptide repeat protein [Treponema sp.]
MQLKVKEALKGIVIVLVIAAGIWVFFRYQHGKAHRDLAKKIAELSPGGGPPETIEGLRAAIAAYEEQIELNVKEGAQTGVYWKILATRLADRGMHRDALDALERAIYFNGEEPTLFYLTGISAAVAAKSSLDFPGVKNGEDARNRYFALAESAHLRAIELDPGYSRPRYAIGILYVFELDRPAEAIPHLRRYLELMSTDTDAMFTLARAYYVTGDTQSAVELYDRIITTTKDKTKKEEALRNREFVLGQNYG